MSKNIQNVGVPPNLPIETLTRTDLFLSRFRVFRQSHVCARGDPSDERLPDRHEASQSAAEETQGCQQALLTMNLTLTPVVQPDCRLHTAALLVLLSRLADFLTAL